MSLNVFLIEEIIYLINVFYSSVYNWIKINFLEKLEIDYKIYVKMSFFLDFCCNYLGKNKFNKYVNKFLKGVYNY